ncbi:hypothetical protein [Mycolicibacterium hippocampi]|uniref:hypothetical protein n=1 Tax=Mycolicibacterium hippocampi TaxID=659824 RepID=UPI001F1A2975|nr:hypothetical protein [Mycolicibacterium hippocampi]
MDAVASLLSQARAERITYHRESLAEAYEYRRRWRAPQWQYDAWVSTYTEIADGQMSSVSGDIERITGVPPLSLAQLLAGPLSNL